MNTKIIFILFVIFTIGYCKRIRNVTNGYNNRRITLTPLVAASSSKSIRIRRPQLIDKIDQIAAAAAATTTTSIINESNNEQKIICYYTNWSQYRPKIGKFLPEDIPSDLCTHLIFAFGWMKKGKLSSFETNDETKDGKIGLYDRINVLKKNNPKLKTLLAIGGWSFGTQKFKEMSNNYYSRRIFIFSAIPYLRERNFDGLDIDWEYPKGSEEKKNYAIFLKELRDAFEDEAKDTKKQRLLLTAAVPVGPDSIRSGYDVPSVASSLDYLNIMAYDFHGKWESQTGHNAPLYSPSSDTQWRKQLSVSAAVELWMKLGAPKNKLIIGMPTYGRSFTLNDKTNYSINVASKGGGLAGVYTREGGFLAYYEICELLRSGISKYIWDDEMKVPYLVHDDQWIGFDDERSIRNKMKWILENKFAGAMVWTIDMDDFNGNICSENGGKYPLIRAMKEELFNLPKHKDVDWEKIAGKNSSPQQPIIKEMIKLPATSIAVETKKKPIIISSSSEEEIDMGKTHPPTIFCYLKSKSIMSITIDANLCTHITLAFGKLKDNHLENEEILMKLSKLKEKNTNLKILISLNDESINKIIESKYKIGQFIYDSMEFLRERNIDGIDLYYEKPRSDLIIDLIRELRLAFEGEAKSSKTNRLLITMTLPDDISELYSAEKITKYIDYFSIKTFDFNNKEEEENIVQHSSPLYAIDEINGKSISTIIKNWQDELPAEKILISITTIGKLLELIDMDKFDIGARIKNIPTSTATTVTYGEVCEFLNNENTTLVWDNEQMVPFAYNGYKWIGFDDERSIKTKIDYLKEMKLGGVSIWTLDSDDWSGKFCTNGKFPLLKSINLELKNYRIINELLNDDVKYILEKKNSNEITCAEEDGHISYHKDINDCTKYFMCEGERKHHMPCPAQLVFNVNENVCDWPENVDGCGKIAK